MGRRLHRELPLPRWEIRVGRSGVWEILMEMGRPMCFGSTRQLGLVDEIYLSGQADFQVY
jgi:hypothetical protein